MPATEYSLSHSFPFLAGAGGGGEGRSGPGERGGGHGVWAHLCSHLKAVPVNRPGGAEQCSVTFGGAAGASPGMPQGHWKEQGWRWPGWPRLRLWTSCPFPSVANSITRSSRSCLLRVVLLLAHGAGVRVTCTRCFLLREGGDPGSHRRVMGPSTGRFCRSAGAKGTLCAAGLSTSSRCPV